MNNKVIKFSVIISVFLVIFLISIVTPRNVETDVVEDKSYGFGLSLVDETSTDENQIIYKLKGGQSTFSPTVSVSNNFNKPYTYRIFTFLDYMQKNVKYNNQQVSNIDISLDKHESKEITFDLNIPEGANDLLVICVRDPNNILDKEQYISSGNVYLARRAVILNGEDKNINKIGFSTVNPYLKTNSSEVITAPFVTQIDEQGKEFSLSRIPQSFVGEIQLNFESLQDNKYALFSILGEQAIKLDRPFIKAKDNGKFKLDLLSLPYSGEEINNNIIIGVVDNPFTLDKNELIQQKVEFINIISLVK
ncbi:hypothetical protein [Bacillus sp. AG4(2022)]|uniref:hypothetical protein n=1 Tax=Bacillus sp. AG4(2022) TaxID=2962594 RepID=UPI002882C5A0|nr:hypothetical protein [Bacillus sp. AG4(2022)]MDT0163601.1 hypothetical protein [Bacillus sp. AG4(2022)]